jgi:hypothetical protein
MEQLTKEGGRRMFDLKEKLREEFGNRPYGGRRLSAQEENERYEVEMRDSVEENIEFIISERRRLGLPDETVDGRPLIPRSALAEMVRLEKRFRGKSEEE